MGLRAPPTTASLLCGSPEPTFAVAMSGEVVGWNAAVTQLLGMPEAKAVGRKCWSVLAGRALDGTLFCRATCPILHAARAGHSSAPVEVVRGRPSRGGTARVGGANPHVVLHHLALRDPEGQPSAVVHLVEDVTERRRREVVGERLRAVATGTGALGVRLTRREREILGLLVGGLTTREAAERLGIRPTTARNYIQRVLAKLGAPNRLAAVMKVLWVNTLDEQRAEREESPGPDPDEPEARGPAHAEGDPHLSRFLEAAAEHVDVALSLCDMSGRILYVNEANARLVGRPARELIGRPVNLLLPPALRERSKGLLATLSREGAIHAELPNVRGDGATVYVGLSAEVARDAAGNPICIVATIRDLSADLQRLEMLNASALSVASAPAGEVLETIVRVARLLIGARYAALGVVRGSGLERFIPDGMTDEQIASIAHWPEGRGLLGAMVAERRTIRLPDIAADPRNSGFPAGHPPMTSFLGVPVQIEGTVYGHLYLTDKIGAPEFGFVDERLAELFAAHAAVALRDAERVAQLESALAHLGRAQAARSRLARVFDESSDEVYVFDAASLRFVDVNAAARRNLGYSDEELVALTPVDLKPEFTPDSFAAMLEALRRGERDQLVFETVHRRKNGSLYPVEVRLQLLATETPPVFIALILDVTDRRRVEAERVRLAAAVDQIADSIMITALDGEIVYVNPAFEHVTGYSRSEVIGRAPSFLKSGRHDAAFYRAMWETLERGEVWSGPIVNRRKDGTLYDAEVVISPVRDAAGRITHYVEVGRDVTHERELEAQLRQAQKMEAVGQLAGGIAHDFNNLINVISGFGQLTLADLPDDDRHRNDLMEVVAAADRAAKLTRQILAFSRRQVLEPHVLDLNEVVATIIPMLRGLVGEHVELVTLPAPDLWAVRADRGQIEQVIVNLAVNARDAMPDGGKLTVETANVLIDASYVHSHVEMTPGAYVLLAVSDTGIGIDEATQVRLFEPFFTTKEHGKGTGLGLATTYGIVKQSGGFIWVYSELGRGSSFKVYLPRVAETAEPFVLAARSVTDDAGSETLLVVEDDEAGRTYARRVLEARGYRVLVAGNGDKALAAAAAHEGSIDLLVTDVIMPGMSGATLAERLVASRPGLRVLFASGYTENTIVRHGILETDVAFLAKPYSPDALARKVREVLDVEPDAGD